MTPRVPRPSCPASGNNGAPVTLIAMPWQLLDQPSIQLGLLKSVLARAGVGVRVLALNLAFMEHCRQFNRRSGSARPITLADYDRVSSFPYDGGGGEWIFAGAAFSRAARHDRQYLEHLRSAGVPESEIERAIAFQRAVPSFLDHWASTILKQAPRIVGFTCTTSQTVSSLALARILKRRNPRLKTILGGCHCDGPMGVALHRAFPWIDVVVRGEAERVLPEVVRNLLAGRPVRSQPGLCFRRGRRRLVDVRPPEPVPMAEVPLPDYDDYFEQLRRTSFGSALEREVEIPYESSRGCWWGQRSQCRFCGLPPHRLAFRPSDPDRVLAQVTALARRHRVLWVSMYDKTFDPRYLETLLPGLRDAGQHFSIFFATKSNLERDHVRLMRQAGVDTIQPGIESLSTSILRLMNKGATAFQNVRLLKWCAEYGIWVRWYFLYGFPGEPPEEYEKMATAVASFGHLQAPYMCQLVAERFSPYHERPQEFGLELIGPPSWYCMVFPVKPEILADLSFSSRYRYLDGREPDTYVAPLRRAVEKWQQNLPAGLRSLRYLRGPGFLLVRDRRPGLEAADYEFNELEGAMYLACEDGATPEQVWRAVSGVRQRGLTVTDVADYLSDLAGMRLVYQEGNQYLALALPHALPEFPFPEALQPIAV